MTGEAGPTTIVLTSRVAQAGDGASGPDPREAAGPNTRVILYAIDAAPSILESPRPTGWAAEGPDEGVPPLLDPQKLGALGQSDLGQRVQALRDAGLDAWAWLPKGSGADELAEYARVVRAARIVSVAGLGPDPGSMPEGSLGIDVTERPPD